MTLSKRMGVGVRGWEKDQPTCDVYLMHFYKTGKKHQNNIDYSEISDAFLFSVCFSIFLKFSIGNMYDYYCIFRKLYVLQKKQSWTSKSMF